jgi:tryptophan 2,3-dioxygenase
MSGKNDPVQYGDYLRLKELTSLQTRRSEAIGKPAHDEYLFIIVHQAYELWFKQILIELDSVIELFSQNPVSESSMGVIVSRLQRIETILKLLVQQVDVIETMTPMDFLDFREFLYPASGFQSLQFRLVEMKLGLKRDQRLLYNACPFEKALGGEEQKVVLNTEQKSSLLDLLQEWLERSPAQRLESFDFWREYKERIHQLFERDRAQVRTHINAEDRERNLAEIDRAEASFDALFSSEAHQKGHQQGFWKMSQSALQGALFILLYRDQPLLQVPFQLLTLLQNIDELMTTWRYRHAQMVYRMLGTKIGTGGSSGHEYLTKTAERHRIFSDLFHLVTFMIPRSEIPEIPPAAQEQLSFVWK